MDMMMAGTTAGSSSTYYCDYYNYSGQTSRVVYRSNYHASSYGGVSYAYANYHSSNTYTYIGSRLAFRGKIEEAESVADFKAAVEVA